MKLAYLLSDLGGGTGDHLLTMLEHWPGPEWDIRIVCEVGVTSKLAPTVPMQFIGGSAWWERFPLAQAARYRRAKRHFATSPPDIVHSYFFWSIIYGRLLKRRGHIRCLVENREDEGFNWGPKEYALLRRTRHLADRVICVSDAVRRVAVEREDLDPDRVTVIRNGIALPDNAPDTRAGVREELGVPPGAPLVGMVSNLNRRVKGVRYFVESVPDILRGAPDAWFVVFGSGKEQPGLEHQAGRLGVRDRVVFAGFKSDIQRYYPALDVSVLTSLSEGLPISVLESMSFRLPVVATRVGGTLEVVVDGETGYLVAPKDTGAFAARVVELLRHADLRRAMGAEGRARVEREFDIRRTAAKYLEEYQRCVRRET